MSYRFTRADVAYLCDAAQELAEVDRLALTPQTMLADVQQVRRAHGARAAALVETVQLRRRAAAKLADAARWLFTDEALQQATPAVVAQHRARRLAGRAVHDVTCSIGGELAALCRVCPQVIGSDLDPVRLAMAAHNLAGAANLLVARADALAPTSVGTVVVADPARRSDGARTRDPRRWQPPLPALWDAYAGRDLVVKCAPGMDFRHCPGEVEVVSSDGVVREACCWSPGLTESGVTRRATVLTSKGSAWSLTNAAPDDCAAGPPGEYVIDPDGAVVRAGLVRHYAAAHGLWQLDPRIAYLTGDRVPPGVRGFRILERVAYSEPAVRAQLRESDCGPLEILVRGVRVDPDALRARLAPRGTVALTLIITRIGRGATVFVCQTPPVATVTTPAQGRNTYESP